MMKFINKTICFALILSLLSSFVFAFGFTNRTILTDIAEIKKNIENEYGVNLILPDNGNNYTCSNLETCLAYIDRSLRAFPEGLIKEITSAYIKEGIDTNIIINESSYNFMTIPAEYKKSNQSADITVNIMSNNFYGMYDVVSSDGIIHELGHFVCDYLLKCYNSDSLQKEFEKLNSGYEYGTWGDGCYNVFVNKNSASSLKDDISDLIWYAEAHADKLRNFENKQIIHRKIECLAGIFNSCFETINDDSKLWLDAIPNIPDGWAEDIIKDMEKEGLIPEEFEGKYDPYVSREDFYILAVHLIKKHTGESEFYEYFNIAKPEKSFNIDPINGDIMLEDDISNIFYNINLCNKKEDIYDAYAIGLISDLYDENFGPEEYMTNLEAAKVCAYICESFEIDTAQCNLVKFDQSINLSEIEKNYINFALCEGILGNNSDEFDPNGQFTYQEAYVMLNNVYGLLND